MTDEMSTVDCLLAGGHMYEKIRLCVRCENGPRMRALQTALRQALAWWEAGHIIAGDFMTEREEAAFNSARAELGLEPLRKTPDPDSGESK